MPSIRQSASASVAHRYWNGQWGVEKNLQIYGRDASRVGLGSNLLLEVVAEGQPEDVASGLAHIKSLVDHQSLFTEQPSTLEVITHRLAQELFARPGDWRSLHVQETEEVGCTAWANGELELKLHILNLILGLRAPMDAQSGLIANRQHVHEVVREMFFAMSGQPKLAPRPWAEKLFGELKKALPPLHSLHIDLGRQEYLCLTETV
jgi:hypothetical protein